MTPEHADRLEQTDTTELTELMVRMVPRALSDRPELTAKKGRKERAELRVRATSATNHEWRPNQYCDYTRDTARNQF